MNNFEVQILQSSGTILEIETINGDNSSNIEIIQSGNPILQITNDVALLPAEFNTLVNAQISSFINAGSGISLNATPTGLSISSTITAGSGIILTHSSGSYQISSSNNIDNEQIQDIISGLLVGNSGIVISYNDNNNQLIISTSGLQPSGDYSVNGHTHQASDIVSGTLDFSRLPFTVTYPVRAVHVGGIISFNSWTYTISPTYYLDGSLGDMKTISVMNFPATSVYVDVSESVTKYLNDYPGRTFIYASLEVVLIDAANRVVGWGTTASNPAANPSNGTAGTSMTINLLSFPSVSNNWVIGGLSASGTNTVDILPITAYKKVASRWLDIEKHDWNNIVNPPATYTPSSHSHGSITNSGSIGTQSGQIVITGTSGVLTTAATIPYSQINGFSSGVINVVEGVYATLNSPSFSGIPTAPTATSGTNNSQIANTQFVRTEISNLVNAAPTTLDTLNELATALGNDPNFATTISNSLGQKANLSGATFTGTISGPSGNFTTLQQGGINVSVSGHTHSYTDITNFASGIDASVSTLLVAGNNININYDNINDTLTISATGLQPSGNYSLVGHNHTVSQIIDAGTASYKNIPSSGNALSGEVVLGSDTRLSNERIPIDASVTTSKLANGSVTASKIAAYQDFSAARFTATASFGNSKCFAVNLGVGNGDVFLVDWNGQITSGKWMGTKIGVAYGGTNATTASEALINLGAASISHTHGNISSSGAIGSVSGLLVTTGQSGILTTSSGIPSSYITNFNSSVSGILPSISGSGYINSNFNNNIYTISVSGLQPSGNYSVVGHTHTSSEITDFNSSVSGLLPVTNILGGTNISVVPSGSSYTVNVSGSLGLTTEEVDDRVSNLLVAGSGISLDYNDGSDTLTIHNTSISPDEIEEYAGTSNFPTSGNLNILYVATNTGQLYKWDGEVYYEAGPQGASTGTHGTQHKSDGSDPVPLTEYNVPQFTENTNNLNHLNKDILYITADANNRELSGLLAPSFCCVKLLVNISSTNTIIIDNQSTNSDPANRFLNYTGADYYLLPGQSLSVLYSTEAMRWRIL